MPDYPLYHVDAFVTERPFSGSGAAVVPLDSWIEAATMQGIAAENNLSETAYVVREGDGYRIRWFTPTIEVDLCGHATLASAFVLFTYRGHTEEIVRFQSASGKLSVMRSEGSLVLDFPARPAAPSDLHSARIRAALRTAPSSASAPASAISFPILKSERDWLLVFDDAEDLRGLQPDHAELARFTGQGFIVTAPGTGADYVFRYFAPALGLNEDPATGSVQSTLVPYWAERLGRNSLHAVQLSHRGAEFHLHYLPEAKRVHIGGRCRPYLEGMLHV